MRLRRTPTVVPSSTRERVNAVEGLAAFALSGIQDVIDALADAEAEAVRLRDIAEAERKEAEEAEEAALAAADAAANVRLKLSTLISVG